jgi:glycosyltransferase involved in cell wall biosynthesis
VRILTAIQELPFGGAERVVATLVSGAREAGHEAAVAAAPGPLGAALGLEPFPLPLVERRPGRIPAAALALRRAVRAWRPDLVHAHNPGMALVTSLATARGRRPRALVSVHGVPDQDYRTAARALRLAGLPAVACGPGVAAALAEHGFRVRATIINGIAPAPPAADRGALDVDWDLAPGTRLIVSAGRLVEQKNHALAVRALAQVPGAALAILGDGPLRGAIVEAAERAGVPDRLVLAGPRPDARAVLAAADAVVLPSVWEGLPLVALEALAAGTPLVATAVRGTRELLDDGRTALLVAADDPEALAAALRRVLGDAALRGRLAAAGRELAAEHTEERMVREYVDLYGRVAR